MAKAKTNSDKESTISMILGALVVIIVGILVYNYFTNLNKPANKQKNGKEAKVEVKDKGQEEVALAKGEFPKKYKVKAGDNLWKIAQQAYGSGYNWIDIASHNKLVNPNYIQAGQQINLPKVKIRKGDVAQVGAADASEKAITKKDYTVQRGDYLWDIAVRACGDGFAWSKIAKASKLENPDLIHKGNKLKIVCK